MTDNKNKLPLFVRTDSEVFTSSSELVKLLNRPCSAKKKTKVSVWLNRLRSAKKKTNFKESNIWLNRLRSAKTKSKCSRG